MPLFKRRQVQPKIPVSDPGQSRVKRVPLHRPVLQPSDSINGDVGLPGSLLGSKGQVKSPQLMPSDVVMNSPDDLVGSHPSPISPLQTSSRLSKTFDEILHDKDGLQCFIQFMEVRQADHLIRFWLDAKSFHASTLTRMHTHSLQSVGLSGLLKRRFEMKEQASGNVAGNFGSVAKPQHYLTEKFNSQTTGEYGDRSEGPLPLKFSNHVGDKRVAPSRCLSPVKNAEATAFFSESSAVSAPIIKMQKPAADRQGAGTLWLEPSLCGSQSVSVSAETERLCKEDYAQKMTQTEPLGDSPESATPRDSTAQLRAQTQPTGDAEADFLGETHIPDRGHSDSGEVERRGSVCTSGDRQTANPVLVKGNQQSLPDEGDLQESAGNPIDTTSRDHGVGAGCTAFGARSRAVRLHGVINSAIARDGDHLSADEFAEDKTVPGVELRATDSAVILRDRTALASEILAEEKSVPDTELDARDNTCSPTELDARDNTCSPTELDARDNTCSPTELDARDNTCSPTELDARDNTCSPTDRTLVGAEELQQKLRKSIETDAVSIFSKYVAQDAPKPIGVDDALRGETIRKICKEDGQVDPDCFVACQQFVIGKMEKEYFKTFSDSEFHCRHQVNVLTSSKVYLADILYNEHALCYFMEFMEQEGASTLMQFWMAADNFHQQLVQQQQQGGYDGMQAQADAMVLYDKFFSLQASTPLGFDDTIRFDVEGNICHEGGPLPDCFSVPQSIVLHKLDQVYFPRYLKSEVYYRYLSDLVNTVQIAQDVPIKKHRRQASDASSEHSAGGQSTGGESISSKNTLLAAGSRKALKTSVSYSAPPLDRFEEHLMSMDLDLFNPDTLWARPGQGSLSLGKVNSLGQFVSEFELDPDGEKKKGGGFFRRKKEKEKEQEEMAVRVAQMILNDVATMTKTGEALRMDDTSKTSPPCKVPSRIESPSPPADHCQLSVFDRLPL